MRTGIYVYVRSEVSIATSEDRLKLEMMGGSEITYLEQANTLVLEPGVYKVISNKTVTATSQAQDAIDVVARNDKDKWPDPPPKLSQLFAYVTSASLQEFIPINARVMAEP